MSRTKNNFIKRLIYKVLFVYLGHVQLLIKTKIIMRKSKIITTQESNIPNEIINNFLPKGGYSFGGRGIGVAYAYDYQVFDYHFYNKETSEKFTVQAINIGNGEWKLQE